MKRFDTDPLRELKGRFRKPLHPTGASIRKTKSEAFFLNGSNEAPSGMSGGVPTLRVITWLDRQPACAEMFYALAGGASATAASPVRRRKVNVSCR